MIDIYSDYEPNQLIIYTCEICKKEVRGNGLLRCIVCNKKLCEECNHDGFCTNNFQEISQKGRELIEDVINKKNEQLSQVKIEYYISIVLIFILFMIILGIGMYSMIMFYNYYTFLELIPLWIIFFVLFCYIINKSSKKETEIVEQSKTERFSIYHKYRIPFDEILNPKPMISKVCNKCGRELKPDSVFCDKCGQIVPL